MASISILRRRRNLTEVLSAMRSIKAHCSECMGHRYQDVEGCTAVQCWLYPWRRGTPPSRKKRIPMSDEHKLAAKTALLTYRRAKKGIQNGK